jgi:hypothetical protein
LDNTNWLIPKGERPVVDIFSNIGGSFDADTEERDVHF